MPLEYADRVRFIWLLILGAALLCGTAPGPAVAQQEKAPARGGMFSGSITAMTETTLTVTSTASKTSRSFAITPETRFEGPKPQVNSRVDIRFVTTDEGDRAVRVIVRGPAKSK